MIILNVFLKKFEVLIFYEILETGCACTSVTSSQFEKASSFSVQKSIQIPSQTKGNSKWSTDDESAIDCHVSKQGLILFTLL